jgi:rhodanese-related sulfurtransferase
MHLLQPIRTMAWMLVKRWVRRSFPNAPSISTQDLADWLGKEEGPRPILIDARKDSEFAVSHLLNAHHASNVEAIEKIELPRHQPAVVYCSIGYRSARLVEKLQQAGFTNVYNLEGSIFQWANEGRPLVKDGVPVQAVHPYNKTWGLLLNSPDLRA